MEKQAEVKLPRPLSGADLAPLIHQYANTNACWYLSPRSEIGSSPKQPNRAELIIELDDQQVGCWQLNPMTYASIVSRHLQAQEDLFTIPHIQGYEYENYEQLISLKEQANSLLMGIQQELNKMLWARYTLDDTAGIDLQQALVWWERAEQVEATISLEKLWNARPTFGSPLFKSHSDYLAELLAPVQTGYKELEAFLAEFPPPTRTVQGDAEVQTDGKGTRYKERYWYREGFHGEGPIINSYYCPYNELERIPGKNGMRVKKQFYPNAPAVEYAPFDDVAEYLPAQEEPVREQLLHIRQLIDNLLDQLD